MTRSGSFEAKRARMRIVGPCLILAAAVPASPADAQSGTDALAMEPACQVLTPAMAGGPMPHDPSVFVMRWMGVSNMELAYRGQVILLDAYYERPPRMHPIGVKREEITRADALFVGHAHGDHVADAEFIARRTGAPVIGAPVTIEHVLEAGVPAEQTTLVRGGEVIEFEGLDVRAILGHHNVIPSEYQSRITQSRDLITLEPPLTGTERELRAKIRTRGTGDPRIAAEGTIGFFFEFDTGFNIMWVNSPGPVTDAQKELVEEVGNVNLGLFPYTGGDMAIGLTMEFVRLFRPDVVIPIHHDMYPSKPDMPTVPLFTVIRDEFPDTRTYAPLYRTPVCVNIDSGAVFIGR